VGTLNALDALGCRIPLGFGLSLLRKLPGVARNFAFFFFPQPLIKHFALAFFSITYE